MAATILWTLVKDSHQIVAIMRPLNDFGGELLFTFDGEVYFSKIFRQSATLLEAASQKREEIEAQGWGVQPESGESA